MTRFLSDWGILVAALLGVGLLAYVRIQRERRARQTMMGARPRRPLDVHRIPLPITRLGRRQALRMDRVRLHARGLHR